MTVKEMVEVYTTGSTVVVGWQTVLAVQVVMVLVTYEVRVAHGTVEVVLLCLGGEVVVPQAAGFWSGL